MTRADTGAATRLTDEVLARIPEAEAVVAAHLNRTEVRRLTWLAPYQSRPVHAKFETQQTTGSFKPRGALAALSRFAPGERVYAASAGNHGLAVAWAASVLGLEANIVLPENGSPVKRERCLQFGAGIVLAGATLDDAADEARILAARDGARFVSPYNDLDVVAGQATVFLEMLRECPDLATLVVPVGGGGLIAGAIVAREALGHPCAIVGVEPEQFASMGASLDAGEVVRLGRRPTFADGLATNIDPGSLTYDLAAAAHTPVVRVSEAALAALAVGVFNRESVLCEAAGAAGLAACLDLGDSVDVPDGPVGTVVAGGNVHHTTFWNMVGLEQTDPRLVAITDTLGRSVEAEPVRRTFGGPSARAVGSAPEPDPVVGAPDAVPASFLADTADYAALTRRMTDDLVGYAADEQLPLDDRSLAAVRAVNDLVAEAAAAPPPASPVLREQRVRVLSQLAVASRLGFEWRSPAFEQTGTVSGFDLGSLGSSGVNYARFDQPGAARIERQLSEVLGLDPQRHAVLLASSGMAAFTLASEIVRARRRVRTVVTSPYLYFEGHELLEAWLDDGIVRSASFDHADVVALARRQGADAVYADPLANHSEQRMIDVESLAMELAAEDTPPALVVDGTMLPTATARRVVSAHDDAVYFESCSKYLQFGLDLTMAGLVVVPRRTEALGIRLRRDLGLGLDRYGAELFPSYQPSQLRTRLASMEHAACVAARTLREHLDVREPLSVVYPGLPDHPDHALATRFGSAGSCVTLSTPSRPLDRDHLDPIVEGAIRGARAAGLGLVKGVSFGFTTSRLSAAAAIAEGEPPFLRLAVGPLGPADAERLAVVVADAISSVVRTWPEQLAEVTAR